MVNTMYKSGDKVIYRGAVRHIIICTDGSCMISDHEDRWDVADICDITPYIESNKEGKHLLERLDD